MLFNTSYRNKDYEKERDLKLGKAFSLMERIKIGGIGSSRFTIKEFSPKIQPKNVTPQEIKYANIELRPKGIIVHFANGLDRYSWVIPYYHLAIYSTETFSIHSNGHFIKCAKNNNYKDNKKFINKMMGLKSKTLNLTYYDT